MPKSKKPRKKGTHSREVRARQSLDRDELPIAVHVLEELIASLDEMKHEARRALVALHKIEQRREK